MVVSIALLSVSTGVVSAQTVDAPACTYETCAVRPILGFWGEKLVRGPEAERVLAISFTGGNAVDFLSRVEAAAAPARGFKTKRMRSFVLGIVSGVALGQLSNNLETNYTIDSSDYAWLGVALGSAIYGSVEMARSRNDLSRAIWEFNRAPIR